MATAPPARITATGLHSPTRRASTAGIAKTLLPMTLLMMAAV